MAQYSISNTAGGPPVMAVIRNAGGDPTAVQDALAHKSFAPFVKGFSAKDMKRAAQITVLGTPEGEPDGYSGLVLHDAQGNVIAQSENEHVVAAPRDEHNQGAGAPTTKAKSRRK